MNWKDYLVLFASIGAIALYGILRTRGRKNLHDYLRGQKKQSWFIIGISVMATQASAITFISTPGQGYSGGLAFVQNYFAVPIALIIISAFFLPLYRKLNVYTAYEFLGKRFDKKTRLLTAILFLIQRALGAGYTLYAPAIVLSTVFGWSLNLTILASGVVVIAYTVVGGSDAVTHTQKYQLAIVFAGMVAAFVILLQKLPVSLPDALSLAGHFGKLKAVDFSVDPNKRYTFWTGMLGGVFLMLSYFGTDQSQVQRYIAGDNLRESRLALMFNALLKIPMQFFILLLGVLLFVFYQFAAAPAFFNKAALHAYTPPPMTFPGDASQAFRQMNGSMPLNDSTIPLWIEMTDETKRAAIQEWLAARNGHDAVAAAAALRHADALDIASQSFRDALKKSMKTQDPSLNTNDSDYVFITFILDYLPHGLIGLLVAAFFAAALGAKAAELNALASTTTIDLYLHLRPGEEGVDGSAAPDRSLTVAAPIGAAPIGVARPEPPVVVAKFFTVVWGAVSLAVALFVLPHFAENLIQATNILGSLFYGVILALFLIAFFLKFITATPAFIAAVVAESAVLIASLVLPISYLWYNPIGCLLTVALAAALQPLFPKKPPPATAFPVTMNS